MKVLVSLPVHEQAEVVVHQLENLQRFLADPVVVLHVSADFDQDPEALRVAPWVHVNPRRISTGWGSGVLAEVHCSSFEYALANLDFDVALMASSNELFVRRGVEAWMDEFDVGMRTAPVRRWSWQDACRCDRDLEDFCRQSGLETPYVGQVEGSFMRREVLAQVLEVLAPLRATTPWQHPGFAEKAARTNLGPIGRHRWFGYPWRLAVRRGWARWLGPTVPWPAFYPREEVFFATALATLEGLRRTSSVTYMNRKQGFELTRSEVEAIVAGDLDALPPGWGPEPGRQIFSVKRVPRRIDDPMRGWLTELGEAPTP